MTPQPVRLAWATTWRSTSAMSSGFFGSGIIGFGVRGVSFGNIDAIDSGSGDHGDTKPVGSDFNWDLVSSRMDGFVGPYLRIGAVF